MVAGSELVFIVENGAAPWGDYGDLLVSGMTGRNDDGRLEIERTGPFVPPITISGLWTVVVTDAFRGELERSDLRGISFEPVVKKRIVALDWRSWNLDADEPLEYPVSGEPEDYVAARIHDETIATAMPPLWALVLSRSAQTGRSSRIVSDRSEIWLVRDSIPDDDLYMAEGVGWIFASPRAKRWLEERADDWLAFSPARVEG